MPHPCSRTVPAQGAGRRRPGAGRSGRRRLRGAAGHRQVGAADPADRERGGRSGPRAAAVGRHRAHPAPPRRLRTGRAGGADREAARIGVPADVCRRQERVYVSSKGFGAKSLALREDPRNLYWRAVRGHGVAEAAARLAERLGEPPGLRLRRGLRRGRAGSDVRRGRPARDARIRRVRRRRGHRRHRPPAGRRAVAGRRTAAGAASVRRAPTTARTRWSSPAAARRSPDAGCICARAW